MPVENTDLETMCAAGWTTAEIAVATGMSIAAVRHRARQLELTLVKDKSRGHVLVRDLLRQYIGAVVVKEEYHIGGRLHLDFYIPDWSLAIEYDGIQHRQENKFFHGGREGFLDSQTRDRTKDNWCQEQGVHLWRIPNLTEITSSNLLAAIEEASFISPPSPQIQPKRQKAKLSTRSIPKATEEQKERQRAYRKEQYQRLKRMKNERLTATGD